MNGPLIGCIADDYTGGTDVAAALRRVGLTTVLLFGPPDDDQPLLDCNAVVVALKTRTVAAADAVEQTLEVYRWLQRHGAQRTYFKYCSTFDSTDDGNIGPVTDALLDAADAAVTLICPASPEHGRTTYLGHHFVGAALLSESSMRHHPLTPMTDPNLVRVLSRQTPHRVGLLSAATTRQGPATAEAAVAALVADGVRHIVVDIIDDEDLLVAAQAGRDMSVLTGGAGLARALGTVLREVAVAGATSDDTHATLPGGPGLILAGSCSVTTLGQVAAAKAVFPAYRLDPAATPDPQQLLESATRWLHDNLGKGPVLIYSSADAEQRVAAVAAMGPETAEILERTLGRLAATAVDLGIRRVVVAGGETSGAVTNALNVRTVLVAGEADTGVPWCITTDPGRPLVLLLKSGNFGRPDLLVRAMEGTTS
ncbi:3-oxo-tetronate kinase [Nakamurella deserti]|uniref:3-oxo-tetronate kinase n=1 Tax=Nakamurella deserti TaxID=2164074 RepID=UPI00197C98C1|nr:3-oxo-tetronate kinase [Nakamurella deserti]